MAELPWLLRRQILGKLRHCLLLQRWALRAPSISVRLGGCLATNLTDSEDSARALAKLRLPAHRLLRKLLRRQVLDDLLQCLGALERVHRLSGRDLLGSLNGQLDWVVGYLLLRPKRLLREGRVGNGTGGKAAISCTDPSDDPGAELTADGRIEQLGEVALVISVNPIGV